MGSDEISLEIKDMDCHFEVGVPGCRSEGFADAEAMADRMARQVGSRIILLRHSSARRVDACPVLQPLLCSFGAHTEEELHGCVKCVNRIFTKGNGRFLTTDPSSHDATTDR